MVSLETPICEFGEPAKPFELQATDGKTYTLDTLLGDNGLLVAFICNHCPYVKAIHERLVRDACDLQQLGINTVAIMPNDTTMHPDDSFENMQRIHREWALPFPYLWDSTQAVAHAYGAICTPDFFGYNAQLALQYRGRLDASRKQTADANVRRDLYEAMKQVADTGHGPTEQIPSMGCSIKWFDSE